jgi:hypothetical protein
MSKEHIHIKRRVKQKDFECDYNGIVGHGETAVQAFRNAKKKYEMKDISEQLEILDADFDKTLEVMRI